MAAHAVTTVAHRFLSALCEYIATIAFAFKHFLQLLSGNFPRSFVQGKNDVFHMDKWQFMELLLSRHMEKWAFEKHALPTRDGYELHLFRLLPKQRMHRKRHVIVMQHGLLETSSVFLLLGEKSLAYRLCVEQGHEVWLTNAREWQNAELPQYSVDELIVDDFPTMIEYVLGVSQPPCGKIAFLGVSQGTMQALGAMAVRGQPLEKKLSILVLVSPAIYTKRPSWFGRGWFARVLITLPEMLFGNGQFFFGIIGFFCNRIPPFFLHVFGWLMMTSFLGVMKQPMFHDHISLGSLEDDRITDTIQNDREPRQINYLRPRRGICQRSQDLSINMNESEEIESPSDESDDAVQSSEDSISNKKRSHLGIPSKTPSHLMQLHALCFRYIPGNPSTSTRNVMHWFRTVRHGSVMQSYDGGDQEYDYLQRVAAGLTNNAAQNNMSYHPPIQVLMGGQDPLTDQKKTRDVMQQLIQSHPDGQRRYGVYEEPEFSHVCFFWGHSSVVSNVYAKIIDNIEHLADWD